MKLSTPEQANAVYFLFKHRKQEFIGLLNKASTNDVGEIDKRWTELKAIMVEQNRLQEMASK